MRGLYVKDIHLLAKQKLFFLATIFITVMNAYNLENIVVVPALMLFFSLMLIFTTITFDEMNHGLTFLFTLPISRRKYVAEKYSLALLGSVVALLFSVGIVLILAALQGRNVDLHNFGLVLLTLFIASSIYTSLLLPIYFKFDEGRSRMIVVFVMAIIFFFTFLGGKIIDRLGIDLNVLLLRLSEVPMWGLLVTWTILALVAGSISYFVSLKIVKAKEF